MKFCPKCDVRLKSGTDSKLSCSKCGYTEGDKKPKKKIEGQKNESEFKILDDDKNELESTIKIDCEKCGHDEAVWWMLQTRSADEPTTQFYRCIKCNHTWRNYA